MNTIQRVVEERLKNQFRKGKVHVVYGARRVGKTTMLTHFLSAVSSLKVYSGTGDDIQLRDILSSENKTLITSVFKGYDYIFIDEAQRIPNIGWGLKILVDALPDVIILATGSSAFDLSKKVGEPLTGRQMVYQMYPFSVAELEAYSGRMEVYENLKLYLVYGMYPEVVMAENQQEKQDYLLQLRNSYLYKDILELENIKNSSKLNDLLKLIAYQIGHEVSLNELSNQLGIAKQTVERYLDLLEKSFIIFKVSGYSANLRKEITKSSRYYFWDNGVRNAIIQNFNDLSARMDTGMMWENYCVSERMKKQRNHHVLFNNYFWRTYDQQEIDMIEEIGGELYAFEFKWNESKKVNVPAAFRKAYPNAVFETITPKNFLDFVL